MWRWVVSAKLGQRLWVLNGTFGVLSKKVQFDEGLHDDGIELIGRYSVQDTP